MTKTELQHTLKVLQKITNPDGHVVRAIAYVEKNLKVIESRKGQLKEQYDYDGGWSR